MKTKLVVSLLVLVAVGGLYWRFGPSSSSKVTTSAAPASTAASPAASAGPRVDVTADQAAVFQRAFWRRPASDDRLLNAERREWKDAASGVEKWQWFVAVQPGPAFREWFFKDNPFELVAIEAATPVAAITSPPAWFPSAAVLATLARHRNREGRFLVFHDIANNLLYATDAGGGFASSSK